MASEFNGKGVKSASGKSIRVEVKNTGSTLSDTLEPTLWSPANTLWVEQQNTGYKSTSKGVAVSGVLIPDISVRSFIHSSWSCLFSLCPFSEQWPWR
jgi:hypothetical protein